MARYSDRLSSCYDKIETILGFRVNNPRKLFIDPVPGSESELMKIQENLDKLPKSVKCIELEFSFAPKWTIDEHVKTGFKFRPSIPDHVESLSLSCSGSPFYNSLYYPETEKELKYARDVEYFFSDFFDSLPLSLKNLEVSDAWPGPYKIFNPPPFLACVAIQEICGSDHKDFSKFISITDSLQIVYDYCGVIWEKS